MSEHNTQPSPRILRMEQELAALQEKCNKIREFTKSDAWQKVNQLNRELLGTQYSAMQTYARILNIRLKIAYGEDARAGRPTGAAAPTARSGAVATGRGGAVATAQKPVSAAQRPVAKRRR